MGARETIKDVLRKIYPNWLNHRQISQLTGIGSTSMYSQLKKLCYWGEIESKYEKCNGGYMKIWRYVKDDNKTDITTDAYR